MTRFALPLALVLALGPMAAGAQEDEDGFSLMEEGARIFLRGLMNEVEPALEDLEGAARELQPALRALAEEMGPALALMMSRIDDIQHYEAPEILENGDILIRRSPDAPPYRAPGTEEPEAPAPEAAEPPEAIDL